ncbi:hypothetical protein PR202_ga04529 [Eleusine coracana subsp. coracana]|uniref:NAD kinase 1 n=1 Tax=Eleusine coracana subsp. coracana TaxID=191504 RepID=A0AAV5BRU8_ELECO|nr:hypothetical protein PR202_ga04529 [Eleusine coracana subsp. coracana]
MTFLLLQVRDEKINLSVATSHQTENGTITTVSSAESEKAAYAFIPQTPIKSTDAHLFEFSEAMRTVAKTLRRVAEGKAAAQAEAAEWKRKYELEMEAKEHKHRDVIKGLFYTIKAPAPFKLSWGCGGDKNGQYKHEFVSFEKGDIKTAERSKKQILLKWESPPQTVLFVTKPNSNSVHALCAEMVRWLKEHNNINVFVEPRVRKELLTEDLYFNFIQTWDNDQETKALHTKVDLVVTLGGDGTVLWAASLFKGPVPPVVAFSLGSLGFMTPFRILRHYFQFLLIVLLKCIPRYDMKCLPGRKPGESMHLYNS